MTKTTIKTEKREEEKKNYSHSDNIRGGTSKPMMSKQHTYLRILRTLTVTWCLVCKCLNARTCSHTEKKTRVSAVRRRTIEMLIGVWLIDWLTDWLAGWLAAWLINVESSLCNLEEWEEEWQEQTHIMRIKSVWCANNNRTILNDYTIQKICRLSLSLSSAFAWKYGKFLREYEWLKSAKLNDTIYIILRILWRYAGDRTMRVIHAIR